MTCCVYAITNSVNGKKYVGGTTDVDSRFDQHKEELRQGRHCNKHLQRDWTIDGEESFGFSVLKICERESLIESEQFFIESMKALDREYGYNIRTAKGKTESYYKRAGRVSVGCSFLRADYERISAYCAMNKMSIAKFIEECALKDIRNIERNG